MPVRLLPLGEHAVLAEVRGADEVLALADRLRQVARPGWEVVPAARTVMVRVPEPGQLAAAREAVLAAGDLEEPTGRAEGAAGGLDVPLQTKRAEGAAEASARERERTGDGVVVTVPVVYDGPDLEEVADLTGLAVDEVVAAHTGTEQVVAFIGFAPGFAYLVGGDPRLEVPRRSTPRTSVPAGAVGLAGTYSGVYPRSSPGGWQLIGRTDAVLFDVHRDPPALLTPGTRVRFEAT